MVSGTRAHPLFRPMPLSIFAVFVAPAPHFPITYNTNTLWFRWCTVLGSHHGARMPSLKRARIAVA